MPQLFLLSLTLFPVGGGQSATTKNALPRREPYKVKKIENIAYHQGKDADEVMHRLDLYLPKGKKNFPVIFYAHGGGWQIGYKNQLGMPAKLGKSFAGRGIAFISINYRLSPKVKHPEHIRDVARAFAWTHRNIGKYGGNAGEIFVSGHSAGGHLVGLLATNDRYLKEQDLSLQSIRGAMPISGVFQITEEKFFKRIFGDSQADLDDASPIKNVRGKLPPFLILYAENDFPHCGGKWAQSFCKALQKHRADFRIRELKSRNHLTILWNAAASNEDPVNQALYDFVVSRVVLHRLATDRMGGINALREYLLK